MPKRIRGIDNRVLTVCELLNRYRVKYLIGGGVAANLHGTLRSTKDIDILVPKDRENTERLLEALSELPYKMAREIDADEVLNKPITIVGDDPRVDIFTVLWKVHYAEALKGKKQRVILGVRVPYLGRSDLIRSKSTGRPQDEADLEILGKKSKRRR